MLRHIARSLGALKEQRISKSRRYYQGLRSYIFNPYLRQGVPQFLGLATQLFASGVSA